MSNDFLNEIAADSKKQTGILDESTLSNLSKLCRKMIEVQDEVSIIQDSLKVKQEELRDISEKQIPDIFDEIGLSKVSLADGSSVEIQRSYACSITEKNQIRAFKWLRENNHESLIKHGVAIAFKKGEEKKYEKLKSALVKQKLIYSDKEAVHPQTLKAFVKEQIEKGVDFPMETFSVFPVRKTKIK